MKFYETAEWKVLNEISQVLTRMDIALGDTDPDGDPATDWEHDAPMHWVYWRLNTVVSRRAREIMEIQKNDEDKNTNNTHPSN